MLTSSSREEARIVSFKSASREKEVYRTASQRKAFDRLVAITKIKPETFYANLCPRAPAILITGPAGAGKTAIVRAYSSFSGMPMLSLLAPHGCP